MSWKSGESQAAVLTLSIAACHQKAREQVQPATVAPTISASAAASTEASEGIALRDRLENAASLSDALGMLASTLKPRQSEGIDPATA